MDLTVCPECGEPAEIQWRAVLNSTDGPIEHAKVLCLHRHWFLLPIETLTRTRPRAGGACRPAVSWYAARGSNPEPAG